MNDDCKCREHGDHGKKLAMLCTKVDFIEKKDELCGKKFDRLADGLNQKVTTKSFILLLSTLITIFLFVFGISLGSYKTISDVKSMVDSIDTEVKEMKDSNKVLERRLNYHLDRNINMNGHKNGYLQTP